MDFGAHLPLMDFGGNRYLLGDLMAYARAARKLGFAAVSVNDHMVFAVPWLDGPTALAAVVEHTGEMTLATTVTLPVVRGPVAVAKAFGAIDRLSGGRVVLAVGPGSSERDYDAVGVNFSERWKRLDESIGALRALWNPAGDPFVGEFYSTEGVELRPEPAQEGGPPIWVGSWGSAAGLRRTARLADGWLASAYNVDPQGFAEAWESLKERLEGHGRNSSEFPNGLATMWFHLTDDGTEAERVLRERVIPTINRPEEILRERLPIGTADQMVERLAAFEEAGAQRVFVWPVADEINQITRFAEEVAPHFTQRDTR